jgi:hypothetical protein
MALVRRLPDERTLYGQMGITMGIDVWQGKTCPPIG